MVKLSIIVLKSLVLKHIGLYITKTYNEKIGKLKKKKFLCMNVGI